MFYTYDYSISFEKNESGDTTPKLMRKKIIHATTRR